MAALPGSGRAVGADHRALVRELAAVMNQVAAHAGELVGLPGQDPDGELTLGGQVGGNVELGLERVDIVSEVGRRLGAPGLERLEALLGRILDVGGTWC